MRKRENKQNHRPILRRFTTWLHGAGAKCALIYAVGTLVLLFLLNWRLSLVVVVGYGAMFLYIQYSSRRSKHYFRRQRAHRSATA